MFGAVEGDVDPCAAPPNGFSALRIFKSEDEQ